MTEQPKRKIPKWALIGGGAFAVILVLASLGSGGSSNGIDLSTASCESLIPRVIEMSKGRDPEVLEITSPTGSNNHYSADPKVTCTGRAEWSRGDGFISYSAYKSEGGQVILEYKQN